MTETTVMGAFLGSETLAEKIRRDLDAGTFKPENYPELNVRIKGKRVVNLAKLGREIVRLEEDEMPRE